MRRIPVTIGAALLGTSWALAAPAQVRTHRDGLGWTYQSRDGWYAYMDRFDSGATYQRIGRYAWYSDDSGTSGFIIYGSRGRWDSFSNYTEGWSGSGYTPYDYPQLSTYQRLYSRRCSDYGYGLTSTYTSSYAEPTKHERSSSWRLLPLLLLAGAGGAGGLGWRRIGVG